MVSLSALLNYFKRASSEANVDMKMQSWKYKVWSACGSKGFVSGRGYDQPQFPKCPRPRWLPQICEFDN